MKVLVLGHLHTHPKHYGKYVRRKFHRKLSPYKHRQTTPPDLNLHTDDTALSRETTAAKTATDQTQVSTHKLHEGERETSKTKEWGEKKLTLYKGSTKSKYKVLFKTWPQKPVKKKRTKSSSSVKTYLIKVENNKFRRGWEGENEGISNFSEFLFAHFDPFCELRVCLVSLKGLLSTWVLNKEEVLRKSVPE